MPVYVCACLKMALIKLLGWNLKAFICACKELLSPYCQVSFVCLSCELRWSWNSDCDNVALSTNSKRYCHLDLYWRIITLRAPVRANVKPWRRPLKRNVYPCRISLIKFNFCLLNKLILKTGGLLLVMLVMQCYGLIPKRFPQKVPVCVLWKLSGEWFLHL